MAFTQVRNNQCRSTQFRHCEEPLGDVATQGCGTVGVVPLGCRVASLLAMTKLSAAPQIQPLLVLITTYPAFHSADV